MRAIGIDVGKTGAIAWIDKGGVFEVHDTPVIKIGKTKKKLDEVGLAEIFKRAKDTKFKVKCCLERQWVFPAQGGVSGFTLGEQYGIIKGIMLALDISFQVITSKSWQKEFGISGDTKEGSYDVASRLYPSAELKGPKGGLKDGRCDALLIAEYCSRTLWGK